MRLGISLLLVLVSCLFVGLWVCICLLLVFVLWCFVICFGFCGCSLGFVFWLDFCFRARLFHSLYCILVCLYVCSLGLVQYF